MQITRKIQETIDREVIEKVICNSCGEEIADYSDYLSANLSGGYGSPIGDGVNTSFDICEQCVINIMKTFKIPAKQNFDGYLGGGILEDE